MRVEWQGQFCGLGASPAALHMLWQLDEKRSPDVLRRGWPGGEGGCWISEPGPLDPGPHLALLLASAATLPGDQLRGPADHWGSP